MVFASAAVFDSNGADNLDFDDSQASRTGDADGDTVADEDNLIDGFDNYGLIAVGTAVCPAGNQITPTPTPIPTATATPPPTATPSPTPCPGPCPTPTPTATPIPGGGQFDPDATAALSNAAPGAGSDIVTGFCMDYDASCQIADPTPNSS